VTVARYPIHTAKVLEVVVWLANAMPGIDIYHLVKAAFFADKYHLNQYGRPISGDEYEADVYGPLGHSIYRMLCFSPIEQLALGGNSPLPFHVDGDKWQVRVDRAANMRLLSDSDVEALHHGLAQVKDRSFNELRAITHLDPAYVRADGGRMKFEDLLDDNDPDRDEKAEDLVETAPFAVF
jgi:uncharacterized phage-associated protein